MALPIQLIKTIIFLYRQVDVLTDYRNLNPFEIIEDELKSYKGNPFLLPELTSIIELNHSFKGALNTSVRYSYTDMFFGEVLLPSTNSNSSFTTVANLQSKENLGVSTSLSLPVKKWWFSYLTLYANYLENKGDLGNGNIVDLNVLNGGLYGQNTFTLKHNIKMEISGWYSSTSIWQGNMKSAPMGGIDIGFQKKILKDKGNLRIMFSDVFKMTVWEVESITSGMYQKGNGGWESQQVRLNFTYTFGNSNIKANNRKSGNSDETKRIGGE